MAEIVSVVASTHNPRIFWNADQATPDDMNELYGTFAHLRGLLADSRPDVLVVLANDHFDSFFFDNLPTFSVGVGELARELGRRVGTRDLRGRETDLPPDVAVRSLGALGEGPWFDQWQRSLRAECHQRRGRGTPDAPEGVIEDL